MRKYNELESDSIKRIRGECGLKDDKELKNLIKIGRYLEKLVIAIGRYNKAYKRSKHRLDNFHPRQVIILDRSQINNTQEDWENWREMFRAEIESADRLKSQAYDEFNRVEKYILSLENSKENIKS